MSRVAVLAPHPDDEVLGCASVLREHESVVIHVTDGVPVAVTGEEAVALAGAREREARDACHALGARVERFVTLDAGDQRLWCNVREVATSLADLLPALGVEAVYVPAFQCGHPDHDGLYVAAQLARSALGDLVVEWWCYALYALDDRGRPGYGWLHPSLFPTVVDRAFSREDAERKTAALRLFASQLRDDSVVQSWIDAPASERFAPMPPRD
ncbi:MAG TPA: PIG-L family deacetylase, partial [Gaiellaceae bacterium]|nr:PIG-L family deacetylase [Gaiellaceae bacterium]